MYELTAHSRSEIELPSVSTPINTHKPQNQITVDRRQNHDDEVKSILAKWNPIYKANKILDNFANYDYDVTTNTKIAKDVSTEDVNNAKVISRLELKSNKRLAKNAKSPTVDAKVSTKTTPKKEINTITTNKRLAENTEKHIATNLRPTVDTKVSTKTTPKIEVSKITTNKRLEENTKSTIATNARPTVDAKVSTNTRPEIKVQRTIITTNKRLSTNATNTRPTVDAKVSTRTRPVIEVSAMTMNRNPVSDAKSTITTNTRANVGSKSTNTKSGEGTVTKKLNTAKDVSTETRLPLISTAAGLCPQQEECIHEHCRYNRLNYRKDIECYGRTRNILKY